MSTYDEKVDARFAGIPDHLTGEDLKRAYASALVRCDMLDADNVRVRVERETLAVALALTVKWAPALLGMISAEAAKIATKATEEIRAREGAP